VVYGKLNCNVYPIRRKNCATACSVRLRGMLRQLSGPRVRRLPMLWSAVAESLRNSVLRWHAERR
jgi:hypothetical protein